MLRPMNVYRVSVCSLNDEKLRDRFHYAGHSGVMIHKLPTRAVYRIETRMSMGTACKKALALAASEGIGAAAIKTALLLGGNSKTEDVFYDLTGEDPNA